MKININTIVSVQLTESGLDAYRSTFVALGQTAKRYMSKDMFDLSFGVHIAKEDMCLELPLWKAMMIFGPYMPTYHKKILFECNEIEITERKENG